MLQFHQNAFLNTFFSHELIKTEENTFYLSQEFTFQHVKDSKLPFEHWQIYVILYKKMFIFENMSSYFGLVSSMLHVLFLGLLV